MEHSALDVFWFSLAYPVSLVLAVLIGYGVAEVNYRRRHRTWKPSGIESALITIYGLLLSFTLLSSNNALKERTTLIHQSSEAIVELYQESQLLPEATHVMVRAFLLKFLALELAQHSPGKPHNSAHLRNIEALDFQAWRYFRGSVRGASPQAAELRQLLPAFHKLHVATSRLHYSYQERTPSPITMLLLVSSWAIGILVGFTNSAQETRHYFVPILFVVISVLTVQAIRDLDNPELGFIRPNYSNLRDLERALSNAASTDRKLLHQ
ncbi:hypothetical protein [Hymenobacter crusticola]|uniref:DUF4239 domain-containing protein n=1 Tax=Hymenobacter crusticola TaxID=1770526 RepID=A0A243WEY7_9BACT|nr:hypothetical protein [Hymenobacter crusticola]OUJ74255.1 hypothetical protein BXP70_11070 [Hymenobacter crusticola]